MYLVFCTFVCRFFNLLLSIYVFSYLSHAEIEDEYQIVLKEKASKQDELSVQDVQLGALLAEAKELNFKLLKMTEVEDAKIAMESDAKLEIAVLENQLAIISSLLFDV